MSEYSSNHHSHSPSHHSHSSGHHHGHSKHHKRGKNDVSEWKRRSLRSIARKKKMQKYLFNAMVVAAAVMLIAVIIAYTIG